MFAVYRDIRVRHFLVAAFLPPLMLAVRLALEPVLAGKSLLLPFMLAVSVSGWYGGMVPGLIATAWSAILGALFILLPHESLSVHRSQDQLSLTIFLFIGVLISMMSGSLWQSRRRAVGDARALRVSEQRFRATFEQAAVGLAHVSPAGHWLLVNRRLCEIMNRDRAELVSMTFQEITHPEDLNVDLEQVQRMLAGEIQTYTMDKRYLRKGGETVWARLTVSLVRDEANNPVYFISVIEDISAQRAAESALRQLQAELETRVDRRTHELADANLQLEAFSYTVSHDLRAPLRGVQGFARALIEDAPEKLNDTERDYLRRIENGASKMERLIDDLLTFSRLTRERMTLGPVDMRSAVDDAIAALAADVERSGARVEVKVDACVVRAHRVTLTIAIQNLLSNAIKFIKPGMTPDIRVWCQVFDRRVRLWVRDKGIGIPLDQHERVFGVFERLHGSEHYPGTGVGLAIVRKGIERMGGIVGLDSLEGKGTAFWIELPAAEA